MLPYPLGYGVPAFYEVQQEMEYIFEIFKVCIVKVVLMLDFSRKTGPVECDWRKN
jgi:hypothetical protein